MGCVLEVDVDGEGVFFVDKDVLAPFSGKIKNLFDERPVGRGARRPPRVVLHGFPGGAELLARELGVPVLVRHQEQRQPLQQHRTV